MEWLIGIIVLMYILKEPDKPKPRSSGGPMVTVSNDPNSGLLNFLSNEELLDMGLIKKSNTKSCGCVNYTYKDKYFSTEMCSECSEDMWW